DDEPVGVDELGAAVDRALARPALPITRTRKGHEVTEDLRSIVRTMAVNEADDLGAVLDLELSTQPRGTRPAEVLTAIDGDLVDRRVLRTKQWIERGGARLEPLEADARVEAGLADAEPGAVTAADAPPSTKPKIGDTRPAPPSGDGTPTRKRRRRRGGRGRGRARGGDTATGTGAKTAPEAVRADLGADAAAVSLDELDDTALERRRGRTRKGRPAGRYMMAVHVRDDRTTHIGVLEGRSLVEHYVGSLEPDDTAIDGNIYLGKVQNVLPGMEAAFIDIGTPKNGVLYRGDVAFDPHDVEESHPRIERLLKNGQSVLVQVTKNPIGAKGA